MFFPLSVNRTILEIISETGVSGFRACQTFPNPGRSGHFGPEKLYCHQGERTKVDRCRPRYVVRRPRKTPRARTGGIRGAGTIPEGNLRQLSAMSRTSMIRTLFLTEYKRSIVPVGSIVGFVLVIAFGIGICHTIPSTWNSAKAG